MTKTAVNLQDLRRRIYRKVKAPIREVKMEIPVKCISLDERREPAPGRANTNAAGNRAAPSLLQHPVEKCALPANPISLESFDLFSLFSLDISIVTRRN